MADGPLLAIDFGTCYSSAARIVDGRAQAVKEPTRHGYSIPSSVLVTPKGELLVGFQAEDRKAALPRNYQTEFKRALGDGTKLPLGDRRLLPEELVVEVLRFLKRQADGSASDHRRAIVTVPAAHAEHKRALMREAARAAGFDDVELLDEPVAAALARDRRDGGDELVLVYDLGGGTFDAALVEFSGAEHRVLDKDGCDVGGANFDRAIERDLAAHAREELAAVLRGLRSDDPGERIRAKRAEHAARDFCERAKKHLSQHEAFDDALVAGDTVIEYELTRERLQRLVATELDDTIGCCRRLLERRGLAANDVDAILMVGGSCRLPFIGAAMQAAFGRPVHHVADPELAVCLGAALWDHAREQRKRAAASAAEHKRDERRRRAEEKQAAREREQARQRAARNQASVTKLVQELFWDDLSEQARAWLLDAVLTAAEEEEIQELITEVGRGDDGERDTALLVTSKRLLWTRPDGEGGGVLALAGLSGVAAASTAEDGLCGLRVCAAEACHRFDIDGITDAGILDWVDYVAERLPAPAPARGVAIRANLRTLTAHPSYLAAAPAQRAWLAHAIASADVTEEIWMVERDGVLALVTTTARLLWMKAGETGSVPIADITKLRPRSAPDRGLYGFVVHVGRKEHHFALAGADQNLAFLRKQRGEAAPRWALNLDQLRAWTQGESMPLVTTNWLEHAVIDAPYFEQLRWFVRCTYAADWSKTTAVVLTTVRVVWARNGAFAGLSTGAVPYGKLTKIDVDGTGVVLSLGAEQHRFGITDKKLLAELRERSGA